MAKAKYYDIYVDLKEKIEQGIYPFQEFLPSENTLRLEYDCSRNTIRRALSDLAADGYIQSRHGKGVAVIYQPYNQTELNLVNGETARESTIRHNKTFKTDVIHFQEMKVTEEIHQKTTLPLEEDIYYIERIRYIDDVPLILHCSYFLKSIVRDLTVEIAKKSIYEYMENTLNESIGTTKRTITVERATEQDKRYLDLEDFNCVAVVHSHTHNNNGVLFEFSQTRHVPEKFVFADQAQRMKSNATMVNDAK